MAVSDISNVSGVRSRRAFLQMGSISLAVLACTRRMPLALAQTLTSTPSCNDNDAVTPSQIEGPYYTPNSPERRSLLEPGIMGTKIVVTGLVLSSNCIPIARTLLDFWHADDNGEYDDVGYRLRGHQFTDEAGRYRLETIVPGLYPRRTRHFHVKVQVPNNPSILTTQLYFPGEPFKKPRGNSHRVHGIGMRARRGLEAKPFIFMKTLHSKSLG
jgi:protocatechuate 3,4-dioxygenase beta subunit